MLDDYLIEKMSGAALTLHKPTPREVAIVLDKPWEGNTSAYVTVFPDGELTSVPGGRLVDDGGMPVPFEAEATGWWNTQKSRPKWLLLHFKVSTDRRYLFEPGTDIIQ